MPKLLPRNNRSLPITMQLDEAGVARLAQDFAIILQKGDLLMLSGDLAAGKTFFTRHLLQHLANDQTLEVPSPTYTICIEYDTVPPVAHFDLYRLDEPEALDELGWQEMLEAGAVVMEWPERCFSEMPDHAVEVSFTSTTDDERCLEISGANNFMDRILRSLNMRKFLNQTLDTNYTRRRLGADASSRSYELITGDREPLLLMDAPEMPDGPVIKDGKSYSKLANLAENVNAFVAIDILLRQWGLRAPEILDSDLEQGLVLLEHLGNQLIIDDHKIPIPERYVSAIEFLTTLHDHTPCDAIELKDGIIHKIPTYDRGVMQVEVDLFLQWYVPAFAPDALSKTMRNAFVEIWDELYEQVRHAPHGLVLRDYHSPNIFWFDGSVGADSIGVIDFQDALIGPTAYDVASLAQDARVDVSSELENELVEHYCKLQSVKDSDFDVATFKMAYAIMAAQRATKVLGIFVRLNQRDGKPEYMNHLPRLLDYLKRSLRHPSLEKYGKWLEDVIEL